MKKYVCSVCGYIYDPQQETPTVALPQVQHLKTFPTTGYAHSVV